MNRRNVTLGDLYGSTRTIDLAGTSDQVTEGTVAIMWAMVHDTDRSQAAQRVASRLAAQCGQRDFLCQLSRIYSWITESVRFKRDTFGAEHLRHPDQLIAEIERDGRTSADCDDVAMLGAALVRAMGFEPAIIVQAATPTGPFEHVYFGAILDGGLVHMDPQERTPFGYPTPPTNARRRVFRA